MKKTTILTFILLVATTSIFAQGGVDWSVNPQNHANVNIPLRKPGRDGDLPVLPVGYINISQFAANGVSMPTKGPKGYLLLFIFDVSISGRQSEIIHQGQARKGIWSIAKILDPGQPAHPGDLGRSFTNTPESPGAVVRGFFWDDRTSLIRYPTHAEAANSVKN
ncbi:MAG: hypothetical protein SFV55_00130 [Haliscomenobacter sp.]|uniref:hypothetical protein n=1 Tax=Haliscomenobacter sp. TaxID=2717303 RepID=UPI0029A87DFB|nr:hypothetical protein [Haliscomenobacter sp.]MDX2066795.1 hypothetical protein [Haliscomenobacter sp.]